MMDLEGNEVDVPSATDKGPGYRYFRDTKFLPILKEIFDKPPRVKKRRCRYVIYKRIDASSYYGYMNDEDGILEKVEQSTEEEMRGRALRKWQRIDSMH
jgi:pre-mRNA-splicing factor ISY1